MPSISLLSRCARTGRRHLAVRTRIAHAGMPPQPESVDKYICTYHTRGQPSPAAEAQAVPHLLSMPSGIACMYTEPAAQAGLALSARASRARARAEEKRARTAS